MPSPFSFSFFKVDGLPANNSLINKRVNLQKINTKAQTNYICDDSRESLTS